MLSTLHLGGRNYTCTEIKLSKIILTLAPYPPQIVRLWFQGNGSHLQGVVSWRPSHVQVPAINTRFATSGNSMGANMEAG